MLKNTKIKSSINLNQIIQLTKNEINIAMQEYTNKKIEDFDISDLFYLAKGKIFNDENTTVATVKADPNIAGLYWDEFGIPYTDSNYNGSTPINIEYTNNVLILRFKFKDPVSGSIKKTLTKRYITWYPNIYRGIICYCQTTLDRLATKYDIDAYCDFCDYIIDSYTDVNSADAPCKISTLNNKDLNGIAWNIHFKKGNLYMCADKWYMSSTSGEKPAMFELGYGSVTLENNRYNNIIYSNPEHTETMEYHVWLYTNLNDSTAKTAINLQIAGKGQIFTRYYLHNNLLGKLYSYYLFPKANLNGCDADIYHIKEVHVDNTSTREFSWMSSDGNFKFNSLYYFDYFAPIKLYNSWLDGNYWYWAQNTNLIRFLDLSEQLKIVSRQAFMGCDGQNKTVQLTKCTAITANNNSGNYETFRESKNYTLNLPVCTEFNQKAGFKGASNITFVFGKTCYYNYSSGTESYYASMFEQAHDIKFICNNVEDYWSWSVGPRPFSYAYHIEFNKPLYIYSTVGTSSDFFYYYGNGKEDNPKITIYGIINGGQPGINSSHSTELFNYCDGGNFYLMGNIEGGYRTFANCSALTKIEYEGTLSLNASECLLNNRCFNYLPRLISFHDNTVFNGSVVRVIDMSKCSLDFEFPTNWIPAPLDMLIIPSDYSKETNVPDYVMVVKRDTINYGDVVMDINTNQTAGAFVYCNVDINITGNCSIGKYSFYGATGKIKLNGYNVVFEDDWNYRGDITIE